jgi:hypothetical protein
MEPLWSPVVATGREEDVETLRELGLRLAVGFTPGEIAAATGTSPRRVRARLRKLATALELAAGRERD